MSTFEREPEISSDGWLPCKPGVLNSYRFESALNLQTRRTALSQMVLIYGSGVFIAFATFTSLLKAPQDQPAQPSKMECRQVRKLLCDYVKHSIVNGDMRASISQHLSECSACDCVYQKMCGNDQDLSRKKSLDPKNQCQQQKPATDGGPSSRRAISNHALP